MKEMGCRMVPCGIHSLCPVHTAPDICPDLQFSSFNPCNMRVKTHFSLCVDYLSLGTITKKYSHITNLSTRFSIEWGFVQEYLDLLSCSGFLNHLPLFYYRLNQRI